ncbi:MAG: hypothetical protein DRR42_11210 [Gammaproteobacteria bacterium]|nr:MAG: hypothetical protein DRR42_11210 [Gammaproteobacteria bacterium]
MFEKKEESLSEKFSRVGGKMTNQAASRTMILSCAALTLCSAPLIGGLAIIFVLAPAAYSGCGFAADFIGNALKGDEDKKSSPPAPS